MQRASLVVIDGAEKDEYVAVSFKASKNKLWGLPGGKQLEGEDIFDCAVRGVREKLGVTVERGDLVHVYSGAIFNEATGENFWVTSFKHVGDYTPLETLSPEKGAAIKVFARSDFLCTDTFPMAEYFDSILDAVDELNSIIDSPNNKKPKALSLF